MLIQILKDGEQCHLLGRQDSSWIMVVIIAPNWRQSGMFYRLVYFIVIVKVQTWETMAAMTPDMTGELSEFSIVIEWNASPGCWLWLVMDQGWSDVIAQYSQL